MYNNPYMFNQGLQGMSQLGKMGGITGALKGINWGNIINNTQKTLGIINQAIPIVYQVRPIVNNAKTMFKVIGAVRDDPSDNMSTANVNQQVKSSDGIESIQSDNQPMFFI